LKASADAVFAAVRNGVLRPHVGQEFALMEAATAHEKLESRATTGATVLRP
jgi:NADPH:quinone reductase